jgi:hypothetical protein
MEEVEVIGERSATELKAEKSGSVEEVVEELEKPKARDVEDY